MSDLEEHTAGLRAVERQVGVVSTSESGLQEVVCLLARSEVAVSEAIHASALDLLDTLQAVQADATTEILVLVSDALPPPVTEGLLAQVRRSDKPTVVCLMGKDPRLVWRAGAIPAVRLGEAAMRAVAWVRGWDQALISSQIEEERDELATLAADLRSRIAPERGRVRGVFASDTLRYEAELVLLQVLGDEADLAGWLTTFAGVEVAASLNAAGADPECGVLLLSLALGVETEIDPSYEIAAALRALGVGRLLPVVHVCSPVWAPARLAEAKASLEAAGAVVMPSNASAALLAGLLIQRLAKDGKRDLD